MTRTMYDATHQLVPNIPTNAQMVAGYLPPSPFAWTDTDWARFPNAVHVRIAVRASTNDGHVLDVETGDATPAEAPGWVAMRRAAGADPSVYCSTSLWPTVVQQFAQQGIAQPHYWVAAYPGGGPVIPSGAVAHQYESDSIYDKSVVADYWPGVDGGPVTDPIDQNIAAFVYGGGPSTDSAVPGRMPSGVSDTSLFGRTVESQGMLQALSDPKTGVLAQLAALTSQVTALSGAQSADEAALLAAIKALPAPVVQQITADPGAVAAALESAGLPTQIITALLALLAKAAPTGGTS
jgi:hypothetical protein